MEHLDQETIKEFYENYTETWPKSNSWYYYLKSKIEIYIRSKCKFTDNSYILNAGSGGNSYGIASNNMYHVDIAENKISRLKNAVIASIERMPFHDNMFDYVICVGSVLNYCDAMAAIAEMSRVLKRHGELILEFENSLSFEYFGKAEYGKSAKIVTTEYMDQPHRLWIYSFNYIKKILREFSFEIKNFSGLHILSSIYHRKYNNENAASVWAKFDCIVRHIPYFRKHAGNIILFCKKL